MKEANELLEANERSFATGYEAGYENGYRAALREASGFSSEADERYFRDEISERRYDATLESERAFREALGRFYATEGSER